MNILFFLQIILESLPISSSGHLKLLCLLNQNFNCLSMFEELLAHIPTLFLLIFTFYDVVKDWFFYYKFQRILYDVYCISFAILITFIGYCLKYYLTHFYDISCFNFPIYYGPFLNTIVLYNLYFKDKDLEHREYITFKDACWLGLVQSFALCGWVSRFAITLYTGLKLGFSRQYSLYISCALQFFICMGATFLGSLYMYINPDAFCKLNVEIIDYFILILSLSFSWILFKLVIHYFLRGRLWLLYLYSMSVGFFLLIWDLLCL